MEKIGSIIKKLISGKGIVHLISPIGNWKEIVGEQIALRARPVRFKQGVLTVHVYDSIWKHHLDLHREDIVEKINACSPKEPVTRIIFKVGELPPPDEENEFMPEKPVKAKRQKKTGKSRPRKYELSGEARNFLKTCRDPELKKLARKLLPLFEPETGADTLK